MKVLIIDDSPEALALAKARLSEEKLTIFCADGGKAGLAMAELEKPDLILLDVDMPELSGFDVCKILKEDSELNLIPIIFLSGASEAESKITGLELGAVDYVTKPFDLFELRARVRAALRTKRLQNMLIENAHIDPLTGLPNRRALMERLNQEWSRAKRRNGSISFIMADVDHFKQVNDTYGHDIGDKVLSEIGRAIFSCCRPADMAARFGGEEFSIIVPEERAEDAACLAERCRIAVAEVSVFTREIFINPTASFGVADMQEANSIEDLIHTADLALYRSKATGRNKVSFETSKLKTA